MQTWIRLVAICALTVVAFAGCAPTRPFRTALVQPGQIDCPYDKAAAIAECASVTPEIAGDAYELHFVEFDDQGWTYSPGADIVGDASSKWSQIDHLMGRLTTLLKSPGEDLNIVLYVHGWKHDARSDDSDVSRFRELLQSTANLEKRLGPKPRRVVGIYVGWRGKSMELPGYLLNLSFWTRKAAALRISHGSVQELFSRLRSVQQFYNGPTQSPGCAQAKTNFKTTEGCRIRTIMIGHSFGAWILYSAVSGPLIEVLNAYRDLPPSKAEAQRAERLADMIVLVNPAFEASRYEPLHVAAMRYQPAVVQPPLLVSITSRADLATKDAFPAGRFFNSFFERPITSAQQEVAMKHTMGHIDRYLTHQLVGIDSTVCKDWIPPGPLNSADTVAMRKNQQIERTNSLSFFEAHLDTQGLLGPGWERRFCGGAVLSQSSKPPTENANPNSLIWNIQTDASLIGGHSDIMEPKFLEFVRQLYDDTVLNQGR